MRVLGGALAEVDGGAGGTSADSAGGDEGRDSGEASRRGEIASEPLLLSASPRSGRAEEAGDDAREVGGQERLEVRSGWMVSMAVRIRMV